MAAALVYGGYVVAFIGTIWLVYLAWSNDRVVMAIGIFCLSPVFGLIYLISNFDEAKIPYGLVIVGLVMRLVGMFLAGSFQ